MTSTNKKKLDRIFSKYIRKRDTKKGYGKCVTCRVIKPYEDLDCGHYISRQHLATRWDEYNCAIQCRKCNRFMGGEQDEFAVYLMDKYGKDIIHELNKSKWTPIKLDDLWAMGQIQYFKDKIEDL